MARGHYQVFTTDAQGGEWVFNCGAISQADAAKQFRKLHPRWRREIRVVGPPEEKVAPEPPKRKATRRRKG